MVKQWTQVSLVFVMISRVNLIITTPVSVSKVISCGELKIMFDNFHEISENNALFILGFVWNQQNNSPSAGTLIEFLTYILRHSSMHYNCNACHYIKRNETVIHISLISIPVHSKRSC
jgi:hypothetical protein